MKLRGKTSTYGYIDQAYKRSDEKLYFHGITVGWVIDTNDPQQMGRIRVLCSALGDNESQPIKDIPWAIYSAPFAGFDNMGTRGPNEEKTEGPVAYGMWGLPKVGAYVLVMCVDGDTNHRVCVGSVPSQWLNHTMPHGRYNYDSEEPNGPLSSTEEPIQPLHDNLTKAFTNNDNTNSKGPRKNYEWRSRGADYQLAAIPSPILNKTISSQKDDRLELFTEDDGNEINHTQGYAKSRLEPDLNFPYTDGINFDSQVYSWVSPGFHALSMDDRPENGRMRFRTSAGHQIILDDTNERIYISTAEGENWVEMDQNGNIDIYSGRRISVHSKRDINFVADENFNVSAKNINFRTKQDINLHSNNEIILKSDSTTYLDIGSELHVNVNSLLNLTSDSGGLNLHSNTINIQSTSDTNIKSGGNLNNQSTGKLNLLSEDEIIAQGSDIHLNGLPASPANDASTADTPSSIIVTANRSPQHEPWARVMVIENNDDVVSLIDNYTSVLEMNYDNPDVGRKEYSETIERNPHWHR